MEVASLMAAHWMSTERSAALSARSRSLENVAMPHCRGGHVATNAIDRLRGSAGSGYLCMCDCRCRLRTQPVQHVSNLSCHECNAGIGRAVVHPQFARSRVEHGSTWENYVGDVPGGLIRGLRPNHPFVSTA